MREKILKILPGFIMCVIIAMVAKAVAQVMPALGAATFAIFLGMIAGNTFLNNKRYDVGSKFSESELLSYAIVLMGATLNLSDIGSVGIRGVLFIIVQMTITIVGAFMIGRALGFSRKFALLMSAGNAVCGSSAIGSVSGVVHPDSKDKGLSITIVNVTGTILMFVLPIIAHFVYGNETLQTSALTGGILQSVGQVIASAQFVNTDVVEMATIFKILRIILIVVIVLVFSKVNTKEDGALWKAKGQHGNEKVKVSIPWYIIGFFLLSIINSLGLIPAVLAEGADFIGSQFEIIALAAIGMRVKFRDLVKEGPKGMLYGMLVGGLQIAAALMLIKVLL
ncbi:MAG: YeiH family protein [Cellulosilyticaceae bacterium]